MDRRIRPNTCSDRLCGDAGAVLIEFATILPFMLVMLMGIVEFGFIYQANIAVSDTAGSAARSLANTGPARSADYNALLSVVAGLEGLPDDQAPQRVVIFDADMPQGLIDDCKSMPLSPGDVDGAEDICNVYSWDAVLAATAADFGPDDCDTFHWDYRFCPTDRENDPLLGLTRIGIWIDVDQNTVTGMFPFTSIQLDEQRIMHVEPKSPSP
jgi:hypothetical protein